MSEEKNNTTTKRSRSDGYRRRRPYLVENTTSPLPQGSWRVRDVDSAEVLGEFTVSAMTEEGEGGATSNVYVINAETQAGRSADMHRHDTGPAAADAVWKAAYPVKSRFWLGMRLLVLTADWSMELFRRLLLLFVIALVVWSLPYVWQIKVDLLDYMEDVSHKMSKGE